MIKQTDTTTIQAPLRVAVPVGATKSAVWTTADAEGRPEGVPVDLALEIGKMSGLEVVFVPLASSGNVVETAADDLWDMAFVPVDDERRLSVDFGTVFCIGESTFLVRNSSKFVHAKDLNQEGATICGIANTATIRSAEKFNPRANVLAVISMADAVAAFLAGRCDAIAMGRLGLIKLADEVPNSRVVDGNFHVAETAIAMPKGRSQRLQTFSGHLRQLVRVGMVAASFAKHGMTDAVVPQHAGAEL